MPLLVRCILLGLHEFAEIQGPARSIVRALHSTAAATYWLVDLLVVEVDAEASLLAESAGLAVVGPVHVRAREGQHDPVDVRLADAVVLLHFL